MKLLSARPYSTSAFVSTPLRQKSALCAVIGTLCHLLTRRLERLGLAFDPRAISPAEGVRAALAVSPFLVAKLFWPTPLL